MLDNGKPGCRLPVRTYGAYLELSSLRRDYPRSSGGIYISIVMAELYGFIQDIAGICGTDGARPELLPSGCVRMTIRYEHHIKTWRLEDGFLQGYDGCAAIRSARHAVIGKSYAERMKAYSRVCDRSVPACGYVYKCD